MKTLGILAILIIIIGGIFIWSRGNNEPTPTDVPEVQTNTTNNEEVSGDQVQLNVEESTINWSGRKTLILNYEDKGTVEIKDGYIIESENKVVGGTFVADMTTITALSTGKGDGEDMLSTHLKSEDFFNTEVYPESVFVITSLEERADLAAENSNYLVTGNLTIKGITHSISFPAHIVETNTGTWEMDAVFDIDRAKWDVRFGSGSFFEDLGDNVIDDMFTLSVHLVSNVGTTN